MIRIGINLCLSAVDLIVKGLQRANVGYQGTTMVESTTISVIDCCTGALIVIFLTVRPEALLQAYFVCEHGVVDQQGLVRGNLGHRICCELLIYYVQDLLGLGAFDCYVA